MNNYPWTLIIWWKRKMLWNDLFKLCCVSFQDLFFLFFFFFFDPNLEVTVAKLDEIRGLKQLFTHCFLLIGKKSKIIINNYCIAHEKKSRKNNNDQTFK